MQSKRKLGTKCVGAGNSAFSKVERGFSRETICSSSAVSFGSVIKQILPPATAANLLIDYILEKRSSIHEATPRVELSSMPIYSQRRKSHPSLKVPTNGMARTALSKMCEIVQLLKRQALHLSAFKYVRALLRQMKDFHLAEFNHKRRSPKLKKVTLGKANHFLGSLRNRPKIRTGLGPHQ